MAFHRMVMNGNRRTYGSSGGRGESRTEDEDMIPFRLGPVWDPHGSKHPRGEFSRGGGENVGDTRSELNDSPVSQLDFYRKTSAVVFQAERLSKDEQTSSDTPTRQSPPTRRSSRATSSETRRPSSSARGQGTQTPHAADSSTVQHRKPTEMSSQPRINKLHKPRKGNKQQRKTGSCDSLGPGPTTEDFHEEDEGYVLVRDGQKIQTVQEWSFDSTKEICTAKSKDLDGEDEGWVLVTSMIAMTPILNKEIKTVSVEHTYEWEVTEDLTDTESRSQETIDREVIPDRGRSHQGIEAGRQLEGGRRTGNPYERQGSEEGGTSIRKGGSDARRLGRGTR